LVDWLGKNASAQLSLKKKHFYEQEWNHGLNISAYLTIMLCETKIFTSFVVSQQLIAQCRGGPDYLGCFSQIRLHHKPFD
jgi:hypothetical protein